MKIISKIALCFFLSASLNSCGTLFSATSTVVKFESEPQGAQVLLGADVLGTTPFEYTFHNESFKTIVLTVKKSGFNNKTVVLNKTVKTAALFNIIPTLTTLPSGVTSFIVDAGTGGLIEYSPNSYLINLGHSGKTAQMEYLLLQAGRMQQEIAQGDGESLRTFYKSFLSQKMSWEQFSQEINSQRPTLLATKNAPEFYRKISEIF